MVEEAFDVLSESELTGHWYRAGLADERTHRIFVEQCTSCMATDAAYLGFEEMLWVRFPWLCSDRHTMLQRILGAVWPFVLGLGPDACPDYSGHGVGEATAGPERDRRSESQTGKAANSAKAPVNAEALAAASDWEEFFLGLFVG